jgi:hypothetical protein
MSRTTCCALLGAWLVVSVAGAGGEIHGTIRTTDDRVLTGPIRWDKNEAFWDDTLDASKSEVIRQEEDGYRFSLFGWEIVNTGAAQHRLKSQAIQFGHIRSIEPLPSGDALLVLKSGDELELLAAGSSDLGNAMRGLTIRDPRLGEVELSWNQLLRVDFSSGPGEGLDARRLYGTVETASGAKLTGFIVWDADELFVGDTLDGEDGKSEHEIPFGEIREIHPLHDGSRVVLRSGDELVLGGSNDVDVHQGHRGIAVVMPGLGTAELKYRDVSKVTFSEAPASRKYAEFDGGRRLRGTLRRTVGESISGEVTWDRDEAYSWETLDGSAADVDYSIPFENIRTITPRGADAAEVLLTDGRTLLLSGTNDVDASNRGVVARLERDGKTIEVQLDWDELAAAEFE